MARVTPLRLLVSKMVQSVVLETNARRGFTSTLHQKHIKSCRLEFGMRNFMVVFYRIVRTHKKRA